MGNPAGIPHLSTSGVLAASLLNTFLGLSRTSELVLHLACVGVGPAQAGQSRTKMAEILTASG